MNVDTRTGDARRLLDQPALRRALELLNGDGEEARVVGGAVRNALLGAEASDFDISTTALPAVVMERAKAARLRAIPTSIAHGTVTLMIAGRPVEVTTLREDIETDGRHAKIRYGRDFEQDARRRDFTINALSLGLDGEVHDYCGGRADLAAGRVRFIGDPVTRIREDYLRILRFFRFSASYARDDFDEAALAASIRERAGLARLSRERIRQELLKLLVAPRAVAAVAAMADASLLGDLLHSAPQPVRLARLIAVLPEADAVLRLAGLAAVVVEDADRLRTALRLSNDEAARLSASAAAREALHGSAAAPAASALRRLLFERGRLGACDGLALAWAESRAPPDDTAWAAALRFLQDTPEPQLPFSGADLMAKGIPSGKPLGELLKRLQANWIRAGFPQDPHVLADLLADVAGEARPPPKSGRT